ncbi:hypothetical protein [Nocardia sp. NPDC049526]|uniref:hypothetical protein n=1 Tax=Nocardia sp. NPDC049526 TaxID=3364316 RepID=UPI0037919CD8
MPPSGAGADVVANSVRLAAPAATSEVLPSWALANLGRGWAAEVSANRVALKSWASPASRAMLRGSVVSGRRAVVSGRVVLVCSANAEE